MDYVNEYSNKDFKEAFRMKKKTFQKLAEEVGSLFKKQGESTNGKSLSPTERLYIFLHTCADDVSNAGS